MSELMAVNPTILKWARESINLSIDEVALAIFQKIEKADIVKGWENGTLQPTYPKLEEIAKLYSRPTFIFFFPEPPEEDSPTTEFRSTVPSEYLDHLPPTIIKIFRKLKQYQFNLIELLEKHNGELDLFRNIQLDHDTSIPEIALILRDTMKIDIEVQKKMSCKEFFTYIRDSFNEHGIWVFTENFANNDFSGMCIYDPVYPVVMVNSVMSYQRKSFTLFHELAHLLLDYSGLDVLGTNPYLRYRNNRYSSIEVLCNAFAGECLVPKDYFTPYLKKTFDIDSVKEIADRFSVSRAVILRKYLDHNMINQNEYSELIKKWDDSFEKRKQQSSKPLPIYYPTQLSKMGKPYIELAFRSYYDNRITLDALASYLGMSKTNAIKLEGKI
ncbi:MAG: XRE family transcriptional regulator [Caldisericia bacterium]|jgi:Zn-dependent peptidase ImmA (M78 family)/transcriptional regulator with XRE-family HTH domain|nr:XRE family transcriptional regulator [Caldisericia bacterium]MDD4614540.1 XRE family transcriptional regulator [Caldisericia bacterium]